MGWCSLSLSASVISLCLDTQTEELVDSPKSLDELVFFKKKRKKDCGNTPQCIAAFGWSVTEGAQFEEPNKYIFLG